MLSASLQGTRVLDLSQYLPGPYAAQILADLGAEVVKLEPPHGDPMRGLGPIDGDGLSPFYKLINAGKTAVRLDLKSEEGAAAFRRLLGAADVLIESFRPGALARLGFGPDEVRALNPELVHCALSGFGQTGPYAQTAGHDITYMALGGGLATSGLPDESVFAHPQTADYASGMQAALAVLGALLRRARGAGGCFLDVSLMESVLAWQPMTLTAALRPGHAPQRGAAMLNGGAAYYRLYRTADERTVALGALETKFWAAFCTAVGREDWIGRRDEPLPQTVLIADVQALFEGRTSADWETVLAGVDCCFQPLLEPSEVPEHPQVAARGLLHRHGGSEPRVEIGFPALLDGAAPDPRSPLAERDVESVLADWCR